MALLDHVSNGSVCVWDLQDWPCSTVQVRVEALQAAAEALRGTDPTAAEELERQAGEAGRATRPSRPPEDVPADGGVWDGPGGQTVTVLGASVKHVAYQHANNGRDTLHILTLEQFLNRFTEAAA